jgi:hypothetical protein
MIEKVQDFRTRKNLLLRILPTALALRSDGNNDANHYLESLYKPETLSHAMLRM